MHRMTGIVISVLFLMGALSASLFGTAGVARAATDKPVNAGLELQPMDRETAQELTITPAISQTTKVSTTITGPIVKLTVDQRFTNPTDIFMEGLYRFPLPDDASVYAMQIRVGERIIKGVVKEKAQASRDYREAVKAGKRASLLREHRPNVFSTLIGNIAPGETLTVRIELVSLARFDGAVFRWSLPQAITPRYRGPQGDLDYQSDFSEDLFLESLDFYDDLAAGNAQLSAAFSAGDWVSGAFVNGTAMPLDRSDETATLAIKIPTDEDLTLSWGIKAEKEAHVISFSETIEGEHYTLAVFVPPLKPQTAIAPPRDLVFVLDTSGSMDGPSIVQAKEGLKAALSGLRPQDRFDMIEFNSYHKAFFGSLRLATPDALSAALAFIDTLKADGGTNMAPALEEALKAYPVDPERLQQLVFLTDGAVSAEAALFKLVADNLGPKKLFTVGVGPAPNSWFMRKAAEFGRGTFEMITDHDQVGSRIAELLSAMASPHLMDVTLSDPTDAYPARQPDVYGKNAPILLYRSKAGDRGARTLSGHRPDGSHWQQQVSPGETISQTAISKIWARKRIEHLIDEKAMGGDAEALKAQIIETSVRHQILSPETRFIAVDKTPIRKAGEPIGRGLVKGKAPKGLQLSRFAAPQSALGLPGQILTGFIAIFLSLLFVAMARGMKNFRRLLLVGEGR